MAQVSKRRKSEGRDRGGYGLKGQAVSSEGKPSCLGICAVFEAYEDLLGLLVTVKIGTGASLIRDTTKDEGKLKSPGAKQRRVSRCWDVGDLLGQRGIVREVQGPIGLEGD